MNNNRPKGFSLVELVAVIAIIQILILTAYPSYRVYILRAYAAEGVSLAAGIAKAEAVYYAEKGRYYKVPDGSREEIWNKGTGGGIAYNPLVTVDARWNSYFRGYKVSLDNNAQTYIITIEGEAQAQGIIINRVQHYGEKPTVNISYPI
ncbi:type IV pilin protein [Elusimicrobiota bacterium]